MKPAPLSIVPLVLLAFVATVSFAEEDTKSNPYESIAARNPFQLKDPPPPPDPNELAKTPPPPLATVEVTGLVNMLAIGKKKVLLEIVPGPGKPPIKPTLEEGERVEAVEVLFIDVENSEVKIKNGDVITNIALRSPTKAPAGPAGQVPGIQPGFPVLQPGTTAGFVPPTVNPNAASPNASPYDRGNVMVVGGTPAQATPTAPGAIAKPFGAYGTGSPVVGGSPAYGGSTVSGGSAVNVTGGGELRTIPSRPIRTQSTATQDQTQNDPVRQYLDMAIQERQLKARGIQSPPLPPLPGQ